MLLTLVPDPLRRSVSDPHTDSGKASSELSFRTGSPANVLPLGIGQHVFGRHRENIWDVPPPGTAPRRNGPDQLHADRVRLEVTGDANGPGKAASREPLAERRTEPVTGIRQHTAEAHTGRNHAIDLSERDLRLCPCGSIFDRNARPF